MAEARTYAEAAANGDAAKIGPHPGHIKSSTQYTASTSPSATAAHDTHRIQGVQLIDSVRQKLRLPVRTFDTACVYYHHFRLGAAAAGANGAATPSYQDAALASLFVACKVEDTIKKSREILAAAYAVRNPDAKPVAPDDKMFETPGKIIIGLERLILETIGFDFRTRYPQKLLVKIIRAVTASLSPPDAQTVFATAYAATSDMYKTLVPIRRTSLTMALAATELALSLTGHLPACRAALDDFTHRKNRFHSRPAVRAAMSDLLDLYIQHHKATRLGARFDLSTFMDIKIQLNAEQQDAQERGEQKLVDPADIQPCQRCAAAAAGPRGSSSAMRFVFDPEAAEAERDTVNGYFNQEFEEYEVEVEEPIPPPPQHNNHNNNHNGNNQQNRGPRRWDDRDGPPPPPGRGRGRRWRERGGHEHRWGGPYGGGNGGGHRGDRRGRGRYR